jgi:hypothetical protein
MATMLYIGQCGLKSIPSEVLKQHDGFAVSLALVTKTDAILDLFGIL